MLSRHRNEPDHPRQTHSTSASKTNPFHFQNSLLDFIIKLFQNGKRGTTAINFNNTLNLRRKVIHYELAKAHPLGSLTVQHYKVVRKKCGTSGESITYSTNDKI